MEPEWDLGVEPDYSPTTFTDGTAGGVGRVHFAWHHVGANRCDAGKFSDDNGMEGAIKPRGEGNIDRRGRAGGMGGAMA